ncbi:MAG: hypothetical protein EOO68_14350 [Moraxellaceae bacterium]|nr:MAG: hypothetical protein EOO68_14350 [Moraxellaceae bacterium]
MLGDIGHEQLINQIQQINELKGFEVIGVTSVAVDDGTGGGDTGRVPLEFDSIYAASYGAGKLSYSNSTIHLGAPVNQDLPALFATRTMHNEMCFEFTVVAPISQTAGCLGIIFSASSDIVQIVSQGVRVDISPINADINNLLLNSSGDDIPLEAGYTVKGQLVGTNVELKVYDENTLIDQTAIAVDPTDLKMHVFLGFDNTEQAFTQPIVLFPTAFEEG